MSKRSGNLAGPVLLLLTLILLINFSGLRKALQPEPKSETVVTTTSTSTTSSSTTSEASFETRVTVVNNALMVITLVPKSGTKMTNETHDLMVDALGRLNIRADDIVTAFPATKTEPPVLLVRYNAMLHSRATEYQVKE